MSEFLSTMAESSRLRATELRRRVSTSDLESQVRSSRPPVPLTLSKKGFDLSAEAKLASPELKVELLVTAALRPAPDRR